MPAVLIEKLYSSNKKTNSFVSSLLLVLGEQQHSVAVFSSKTFQHGNLFAFLYDKKRCLK